MRYVFAVCVLLVAQCVVGAQQQTEEQKRLMERHKKVMLSLDPAMPDRGLDAKALESAVYLLKRRGGITFVEDRIIEYRQKKMLNVWSLVLGAYVNKIPNEDVPDRMIPEFVAQMERLKEENTDLSIRIAIEFGPRGKAFLPTLEWIRDNSKYDAVSDAAFKAIREIKSAS